MSRGALLVMVGSAIAACRPPATPNGQERITLQSDSSQYTVRLIDGMYRATIGYTYTNRSGDAVSSTHCHTPPPPILEKKVGPDWVRAYDAVLLMCLTIPHFQIADGATYHGTLHLSVAQPGRNMLPALLVDPVSGTYRLRWRLRTGSDPEARVASTVEAISNEFVLIER
jgi:hypothetical protein